MSLDYSGMCKKKTPKQKWMEEKREGAQQDGGKREGSQNRKADRMQL